VAVAKSSPPANVDTSPFVDSDGGTRGQEQRTSRAGRVGEPTRLPTDDVRDRDGVELLLIDDGVYAKDRIDERVSEEKS